MLALQVTTVRSDYQLVKSRFLILTIGKSYCRKIHGETTNGTKEHKGNIRTYFVTFVCFVVSSIFGLRCIHRTDASQRFTPPKPDCYNSMSIGVRRSNLSLQSRLAR